MNTSKYQFNCLLVLIALACFSSSAPAMQTPRLNGVDRIELMSIDYEKGYIKKVIASKVIEGKEASNALSLWKRQKLLGRGPSACHQPAYAMKFYSKEKLVMFVTICWGCRNIDFVVPRGKHWIQFQADSQNGQRLKSFLIQAFPDVKPVISRATEQTLGADSPVSDLYS